MVVLRWQPSTMLNLKKIHHNCASLGGVMRVSLKISYFVASCCNCNRSILQFAVDVIVAIIRAHNNFTRYRAIVGVRIRLQ